MMHFFIFLFSFLSCAAYDMHGCALHTYEWCVCVLLFLFLRRVNTDKSKAKTRNASTSQSLFAI